ncbi:hypothetical protein [Streptomyces tunisiensis]|uniref:hypothetical protein n=1 Tax=Streptomyces tunisiensis TaxID=948699 RepID=UPI00403DD8A8
MKRSGLLFDLPGAAEADHDSEAKKFNFSVKPIPAAESVAGGNTLRGFYAKNRIIDGMDTGSS